MTKATALTLVYSASFVGGLIFSMFGGWTEALSILLIVMVLDYITGIMVAAVFHNSDKSESGSLSSVAGFKGIAKKVATLILVVLAYQMDKLLATTIIKDGVCLALCVNEIVSILENVGLMGITYPAIMQNAIDVLKGKADNVNSGTDNNELP